MELTLDFLLQRPRRVRIRGDKGEFMVSVISNNNQIKARSYSIFNNRPQENEHFTIPPEYHHNWFEVLELASDPCRHRKDREFVEHND